jgi:hypothetical protein
MRAGLDRQRSPQRKMPGQPERGRMADIGVARGAMLRPFGWSASKPECSPPADEPVAALARTSVEWPQHAKDPAEGDGLHNCSDERVAADAVEGVAEVSSDQGQENEKGKYET